MQCFKSPLFPVIYCFSPVAAVFQLMDHTGAVPAKLFDTDLEVSTLVHPFGWWHWSASSLIDNHCHPLELVHLYVAVQKPVARIIRSEIDDNVPPCRDHHCVLSDGIAIDRKVFCYLPTWSGASSFVAAWFSAVDIIAVYITVMFSNKTGCAVILWISNMNNMKCVAMKMYWMGIVVSTNCCKHQLNSFPWWNVCDMDT